MSNSFNSYLANDYDALRRYLGEVRFNALAIECNEPNISNIRLLSSKLPEQIARLPQAALELGELATLERALREAFEAVDPSGMEVGSKKNVTLHPSVKLLTFTQNTVSIWSSLKCGEPPPRPYQLDNPQHVLVWRQNAQPRMRLLGEEEYSALAAIRDAPGNVDETYLCGWLESGVLINMAKCGAVK